MSAQQRARTALLSQSTKDANMQMPQIPPISTLPLGLSPAEAARPEHTLAANTRCGQSD